MDTDGDRIVDARDECPNEAEDLDDFEDEDGCPDLDNDADRILDEDDHCPSEQETYNGTDDEDGCPDHAPVAVHHHGGAVIERAYFRTDSSEIDPRVAPILDAIAATLEGTPEIERVACVGRASPTEKRPLRLSRERAEGICRALVDRGVDPARLESFGLGTRDPIQQGAHANPAIERSVTWTVMVVQGVERHRWNGRTLERVGPAAAP